MKTKFDIILFDMDGTIADTDRMIVETYNKLYELYRDNIKTPIEEIYYFSGPPLRETLKKEFPHMDVEFIYKEYKRVSYTFYDDTITPMEGSLEVLLKLKEMGIKLGIVTNKARIPALRTLEIIKFIGIFDTLVALDDVKVGKPSNEGINKALSNYLNVDKDRVLYVGDNVIDDISAKNAGIKSAIIYFGKRKMPEDLKPDIKLYSYLDLLKEVSYE